MPAEATLEQTEKLACTQILDYAKTFFQDPKNQQAFQIWLKSNALKSKSSLIFAMTKRIVCFLTQIFPRGPTT